MIAWECQQGSVYKFVYAMNKAILGINISNFNVWFSTRMVNFYFIDFRISIKCYEFPANSFNLKVNIRDSVKEQVATTLVSPF